MCSNLYVCLDLREEIDKFDVGRQEEGASAERAEVVLRVKQPELKEIKIDWNFKASKTDFIYRKLLGRNFASKNDLIYKQCWPKEYNF